jgi:hypothetical protein
MPWWAGLILAFAWAAVIVTRVWRRDRSGPFDR